MHSQSTTNQAGKQAYGNYKNIKVMNQGNQYKSQNVAGKGPQQAQNNN